jgi:hypothetical protein
MKNVTPSLFDMLLQCVVEDVKEHFNTVMALPSDVINFSLYAISLSLEPTEG